MHPTPSQCLHFRDGWGTMTYPFLSQYVHPSPSQWQQTSGAYSSFSSGISTASMMVLPPRSDKGCDAGVAREGGSCALQTARILAGAKGKVLWDGRGINL